MLFRSHEATSKGIWHDPRLDFLTGLGLISELGVGFERMTENDHDPEPVQSVPMVIATSSDGNGIGGGPGEGEAQKLKSIENSLTKTMPIVAIKNYATKRGKDEVLEAISAWAGRLVENQVS